MASHGVFSLLHFQKVPFLNVKLSFLYLSLLACRLEFWLDCCKLACLLACSSQNSTQREEKKRDKDQSGFSMASFH